MDFSKSTALHRLYGHAVFVREAERAGKTARFIKTICANLKCTGKSAATTWRDHIVPNSFSDRQF